MSVDLYSPSPRIGDAQLFITTDFPRSPRPVEATSPQNHPYIGIWWTNDGNIRHELLLNGRYDEARGGRESAIRGDTRSLEISFSIGMTQVSTLTASSVHLFFITRGWCCTAASWPFGRSQGVLGANRTEVATLGQSSKNRLANLKPFLQNR